MTTHNGTTMTKLSGAQQSTTTSTGLKVYARLDRGHYEKGIKVTDHELAAVNIDRDAFHPDWNYTIHPAPDDPLIIS
jgi:hypothetical protein